LVVPGLLATRGHQGSGEKTLEGRPWETLLRGEKPMRGMPNPCGNISWAEHSEGLGDVMEEAGT